jgi:hypothetical protein
VQDFAARELAAFRSLEPRDGAELLRTVRVVLQ